MHHSPAATEQKRECPICKTDEYSKLYLEANFDIAALDQYAFASRKVPEYMHLRLARCRNCDLIYANPMFDHSFLEASYKEASFDSGIEAILASKTYAKNLKNIKKRLPDYIGALDIGTGEGAFLARLKEYEFEQIQGVEPSEAPIALASPEIQPLIKSGFFNGADFKPNSFSLITCFQTMEHLQNPLAVTKQIFELLKPGGAAYFVGHNRKGALNRILGRRSPIFDIEHLQLFSPISARRLFEQSGFVDVSVNPIINAYPVSYWLKLAPIPKVIKSKISRFKAFSEVLLPLPVGNQAIIGFKPGG